MTTYMSPSGKECERELAVKEVTFDDLEVPHVLDMISFNEPIRLQAELKVHLRSWLQSINLIHPLDV